MSACDPCRTSAFEKREAARSEPPPRTWSALPVKAITKTLIVQIAFIQTKRRQPDSRINPYLIGESARAAISTAITFLCSVAHQKARRSVELPDSRSLALAEPAAKWHNLVC
jgi:hypothetical protein